MEYHQVGWEVLSTQKERNGVGILKIIKKQEDIGNIGYSVKSYPEKTLRITHFTTAMAKPSN